jgi:outer membrane protein assembly factor BamD (BamD/ComL family)
VKAPQVASSFLIVSAALLPHAMFGQAGGGGGGRPAVPASTSAIGDRPSVRITGKVALEDGAPPPYTVVIERLCAGVHAEGFTDAKGAFNVELGKDTVQDPLATRTSMELSPAEPDHPFMNCQIRANLPGYRSDVVNMAEARPVGHPFLGTIVLHFVAKVDGHIVSAVSDEASKDAKKAFERAQDDVRKNEVDKAVKDYQKAAQLYPDYAAAWFELGRLQLSRKQFEEARRSFDSAMKADPKYLSPLLPLEALASQSQDWPVLAEVTGRLIKLDAYDYPEAFYYNAVANYSLKQMEIAEKSAREAARLDAQHRYPDVYRLLASILVARDQIPQAREQLAEYLKLFPNEPDAATVRAQLDQLPKSAPAKK